MKPFICAILSFHFFFPANAQTHVLQAGRQYLVVNQDGSVRLDDRPSTPLYLGLEGQIYTKDHNLYLATGSDRDRRIHFTPADAKADKLIFEANPSGSGRFITKHFYEGTLYLVVSGPQLKWRKNRSEGIPVLLKSYDQIGPEPTTTNDRSDRIRTYPRPTDTGVRSGRPGPGRVSTPEDIAAAQKKLQEEADAAAAAAEKKRQEKAAAAAAAPKRTFPVLQAQTQTPIGSVEVKLLNFSEKCVAHFAYLSSTTDSEFRTMQQYFNDNCQTIFSGLKNGTYEVELYFTYKVDGNYSAEQCEGCGQKVVSKNTVTIVNGSQRTVKFESK